MLSFSLMQWIHRYQLFLFDLDGLLVNTEELHFLAYRHMLATQGHALKWSFQEYCLSAHYGSEKLKEDFYRLFPGLTDWNLLYEIKQKEVERLLASSGVDLMPGAEKLLCELKAAGIPSCVVTNSKEAFVAIIRQKNPVLDTITHWITRKDYTHPKPHPESYLTAIQRFAKAGDAVIGFEDTPRGIQALLQTPAKPVMITTTPYPDIPAEVRRFSSLEEMQL